MSATEETLTLLRSMDATLKRIEKALTSSALPAGGAVASDRDLDSQYGDPKVGFVPRDWKGASFKGRTFSACPAEFLDMLAETLDYLAGKAAEKNETTAAGKPVAEYKRKDAARARGWAKRIREGKAPGAPNASAGPRPVPAAWTQDTERTEEPPSEDDSPFADQPAADEPVSAAGIRW